jgi:hypothetical protein
MGAFMRVDTTGLTPITTTRNEDITMKNEKQQERAALTNEDRIRREMADEANAELLRQELKYLLKEDPYERLNGILQTQAIRDRQLQLESPKSREARLNPPQRLSGSAPVPSPTPQPRAIPFVGW